MEKSGKNILNSKENVLSKVSHESSFNSKSETIGKNHPQHMENKQRVFSRENSTSYEKERVIVCCGNNSDTKCSIF